MIANDCELSNNVKTQLTSRTYKNKDIKVAQDCGIPFDIKLITDLPTTELTDLFKHYGITETQQITCMEIRRRGKNKSSAQNCR